MIFANTISLFLALTPAAIFAAPTKTADSITNLIPRQDLPAGVLEILKQTNSLCDLSNVKLPSDAKALAPVGEGLTLRHIAIGRGTQNYTCTSSSADAVPTQVGAVATLFNATCDAARMNNNVLSDVTRLALNYAIPTAPEAEKRISGHHEFTNKGVPLFNLVTANANYGYVQAKPATEGGKAPAPTASTKGTNGLGSVPWLKLLATEGDYKEVYRIHTAGGVAPKTCEGINGDFLVQYSAEYWFYA